MIKAQLIQSKMTGSYQFEWRFMREDTTLKTKWLSVCPSVWTRSSTVGMSWECTQLTSSTRVGVRYYQMVLLYNTDINTFASVFRFWCLFYIRKLFENSIVVLEIGNILAHRIRHVTIVITKLFGNRSLIKDTKL